MSVELTNFVKILKSKERKIAYTKHAPKRAETRSMSLGIFESDIKNETPVAVVEQKCESLGERKFDVYYRQASGLYHRYVIVLNETIRLITLMRISKDLQKNLVRKR
ncbi:hypothetical protein COT30_02700 [Candidatus Micrarchaeota archaeon CG08_land_8_20_14_0_20_49_17]|nr:MAG: hypothetical protein COT30_02700 [Candidatus Micrarchaeota archaeon CG08_land_8_20_14_0_20_49_17]PIU82540.1 MAG: hypothetical protein COS70_00790 [Candidatus Micrarchaeota archaeon CG06_land_8_20_14_3_00_50_6]PIZ96697.1 MAG: hypothetical protein COX84_03655 [Candidatus Micrarchaeota archaeon CG_4_10_14_0_2_um_filter_49_7]HII53238.1 hypothetical protein [Candidatus Micrarchaeota archaeon]